ncbi:MAG TPA: class I SAM-dependent methyltransferase, partial [Acidobacteriaceae bacterium]|nr:class I SAM-dependent methyltransferase [Acidobacteriaceae bacterium]
CPSCSHVWLFDPPPPEQMMQFYDPTYHQAVTRSGEGDAVRWGRLLKAIGQYKTRGAVLDIGCSSGGFLTHLKDRGWELAGIELNPEAAERARQNTGGQIMTGDIDSVEFPPGSFDVITCYDVLEHLYEPRMVFQKVARWLKPGGIFYIFVPNVLSWEARMFQSFWYPLDLPRHLHFFSPASLTALSGSAGLRIVHVTTPPGNYLEHNASRLATWLLRRTTKSTLAIDFSGPVDPVSRLIRKGMRLTVESGFGKLASLCHAAPSLQAVFQKPD